MDEDALAPLADALSATLAVFILLICFFTMGQISAVSQQIKLQKVGNEATITNGLDLEFDEVIYNEDTMTFFNSFKFEEEKENIEKFIKGVVDKCGNCNKIIITSNFPAIKTTKNRAEKRALVNAVKMASYVASMGLDYEIKLSGGFNYHFIKLRGIESE